MSALPVLRNTLVALTPQPLRLVRAPQANAYSERLIGRFAGALRASIPKLLMARSTLSEKISDRSAERTKQDTSEAQADFQQAIDLDQGFAPGYAGLSEAYLNMALYDLTHWPELSDQQHPARSSVER